MTDQGDFLIVGLGNPGSRYEKTRHNFGFLVVEAFANRFGFRFKRGYRLKGRVASGLAEDKMIHLLKPETYMNLSGEAVRKASALYRIDLSQICVVVDDVYLKFGTMRFKSQGGAGGHNGLKSVQTCLHSQAFARLRMGVGLQNDFLPDRRESRLEEFVLANFTTEEQRELPQVADDAVSVIVGWLNQGVEAASQLAGNLSKNF